MMNKYILVENDEAEGYHAGVKAVDDVIDICDSM